MRTTLSLDDDVAAPVGLPWPSLLGFLRLITNPRIFERPRSMTAAWGQVKSWLDCDPGMGTGAD